jgi:hypothetical protein
MPPYARIATESTRLSIMFFDEITPLLQELTAQPIAFLGGLTSGLLRLNLNQDPVKSWLDEQRATPTPTASASPSATQTQNGRGPQSITID